MVLFLFEPMGSQYTLWRTTVDLSLLVKVQKQISDLIFSSTLMQEWVRENVKYNPYPIAAGQYPTSFKIRQITYSVIDMFWFLHLLVIKTRIQCIKCPYPKYFLNKKNVLKKTCLWGFRGFLWRDIDVHFHIRARINYGILRFIQFTGSGGGWSYPASPPPKKIPLLGPLAYMFQILFNLSSVQSATSEESCFQ